MQDGTEGHLDWSNAIWDDGEWISWDEIGRYLDEKSEGEIPYSEPEDCDELCIAEKRILFERQLSLAMDLAAQGKGDEIDFGRLGELYAEIRHRLVLHRRPNAAGSDGKIGKDFVEVKTITPWKVCDRVSVKRRGHFSKLIVVRFDANLMPDSRMISRKALNKGRGGKVATLSWTAARKRIEP